MSDKAEKAKERWEKALKKQKMTKKTPKSDGVLQRIMEFMKATSDVYGGRGAANKVKEATDK